MNKIFNPDKPLRKDKLIVGSPQIVEDDLKDIIEVFHSGWWVNGPKTKQLAEEFCRYIGCKYAVPVGSGTFALHLALDVLGLGPGDEIITTPYTFPATTHVIEYVGAKPVFVDIEMGSYNMDPNRIERAITSKTKAIMPIHIIGRPCDMTKIIKIAKKHHLYVIEDAAHAVEAFWKKKKIGNISDMTCFSFDVTKNVAGGLGGIVTTNNKKLYEKLICYAHFGFKQRDAFLPYDTVYPGYKYDMSEFSAALALNSLRRVKENLKLREKYWEMYNEAFKEIQEIVLPYSEDDSSHARHLYMVLLKFEKLNCTRAEFMKALEKLNIGSRIRFTPVHLHTYYQKKYGLHRGDFPVTEYVSDRVFCLPLSAKLTEKDVEDVIKGV
ncbi:MAG: DegT/DnrJ/EryC1/StrS family aminotransferase, partial [Patescibacteria group bacterium]|nr:DegT/DnrJ/EryC1/StrS family aminotransferase [Patescibacteria group bacterium]